MIAIPVAALIFSALFAGAALYITLVEQPARLCLDDASQLAQWQPSYRKALPLQAGLALAGGMAGLAACGISGDWNGCREAWFCSPTGRSPSSSSCPSTSGCKR